MSFDGSYTRQLIQDLGLVLAVCLQDVVQMKPTDPIEFMAKWLYKYMDNKLYFENKDGYYKTARASIEMLRSKRKESKGQMQFFNLQLLRLKAFQRKLSVESDQAHKSFAETQRDFQIYSEGSDTTMSMPSWVVSSRSSDLESSSSSKRLTRKLFNDEMVEKNRHQKSKKGFSKLKKEPTKPRKKKVQDVEFEGSKQASKKYSVATSQRSAKSDTAGRKSGYSGGYRMSDLYDHRNIDLFGSEMSSEDKSEREDTRKGENSLVSGGFETEGTKFLKMPITRDTFEDKKIFREEKSEEMKRQAGRTYQYMKYPKKESLITKSHVRDWHDDTGLENLTRLRQVKDRKTLFSTSHKAEEMALRESESEISLSEESSQEEENVLDREHKIDKRIKIRRKMIPTKIGVNLKRQGIPDRILEENLIKPANLEEYYEKPSTAKDKFSAREKLDLEKQPKDNKQKRKAKTDTRADDSLDRQDLEEHYSPESERFEEQIHDNWADLLKETETEEAIPFDNLKDAQTEERKKVSFKEHEIETRVSFKIHQEKKGSNFKVGLSESNDTTRDVSISDEGDQFEDRLTGVTEATLLQEALRDRLEEQEKQQLETIKKPMYSKLIRVSDKSEEPTDLRSLLLNQELQEYGDDDEYVNAKRKIERKVFGPKKMKQDFRKRDDSLDLPLDELDIKEYEVEEPTFNIEETPLWENLTDSKDDYTYQRYRRWQSAPEYSLEEVLRRFSRKSYDSSGRASTNDEIRHVRASTGSSRGKDHDEWENESEKGKPTRDKEVLIIKQKRTPRTDSAKSSSQTERRGKHRVSRSSDTSSKKSSISHKVRGGPAKSGLIDSNVDEAESSFRSNDRSRALDVEESRKRFRQIRGLEVQDKDKNRELERRNRKSLTDENLDENIINYLKKPRYSRPYGEESQKTYYKDILDKDYIDDKNSGYDKREGFSTQKTEAAGKSVDVKDREMIMKYSTDTGKLDFEQEKPFKQVKEDEQNFSPSKKRGQKIYEERDFSSEDKDQYAISFNFQQKELYESGISDAQREITASIDRDVEDGDKSGFKWTKSKLNELAKGSKRSRDEHFKMSRSRLIIPAFCVWYYLKPHGVMVCAHPVLGQLRSPQRRKVQRDNVWDRTDVACESLYDSDIYVVCDRHADDEEYRSRMLEWTGQTWIFPLGQQSQRQEQQTDR